MKVAPNFDAFRRAVNEMRSEEPWAWMAEDERPKALVRHIRREANRAKLTHTATMRGVRRFSFLNLHGRQPI